MSQHHRQPTHEPSTMGAHLDTGLCTGARCRPAAIVALAAIVVTLALLSTATAGVEPPGSGRYAVAAGAIFKARGGFSGVTEYRGLTGELSIDVDTASGRATIAASKLQGHRAGAEARPLIAADLIQLVELLGHIDENGAVHFMAPDGFRQDADLVLSVEEDHLVLDGYYSEGCCDRFVLSFDKVRLVRIPRTRAGGQTLLLRDGRFEVSATWQTADNRTGIGHVASLNGPSEPTPAAANDDSGVLYFFSPDNWELMVKVLDGCAINGHLWVLTAGSTTAGYELVVHDTWSDQTRTYVNPVGVAAQPELDTAAFTACDLQQPE